LRTFIAREGLVQCRRYAGSEFQNPRHLTKLPDPPAVSHYIGSDMPSHCVSMMAHISLFRRRRLHIMQCSVTHGGRSLIVFEQLRVPHAFRANSPATWPPSINHPPYQYHRCWTAASRTKKRPTRLKPYTWRAAVHGVGRPSRKAVH